MCRATSARAGDGAGHGSDLHRDGLQEGSLHGLHDGRLHRGWIHGRLVVVRRWTMGYDTRQRATTSLWEEEYRCTLSSVLNQLSVITRWRRREALRDPSHPPSSPKNLLPKANAAACSSLPARRSCEAAFLAVILAQQLTGDPREHLLSISPLSSQHGATCFR